MGTYIGRPWHKLLSIFLEEICVCLSKQEI